VSTLVIGAGIVGVSTALELVTRGEAVTLMDRGGICAGATGLGEGNVLAGDKLAGPELGLTIAGLEIYGEIEARLGAVAGIRRKGSLLVHPEPETWAVEPERVARLVAAGVDAELLDVTDLRAREPQLTGPVAGASWFPGDLQCDPRAITSGLAEEAAALGCDIRTGTAVDAITVENGRVIGVRSGGRVEPADTVVLAAGAWSSPLAESAGLPLPVQPRKGQLARLSLSSPDEQFLRHKIIDGSYLRSLVSADAARQISTVVETTGDGAVIVGSSRERSGFDAAIDHRLAKAMRARAARLIPGLADCPIEDVWVGFRPWLPDHLPAIGASRRVPGLMVATGHEGAGIALGPVTGRVLARVICGEDPGIDLTPFDPDRFA
jgi:glycine/D-amino acid oxidase-like deaminating enzyme